MTEIIAFANQKGGVGKTTMVMNLGSILASLGKRVLIIDLDPQGNASTGLGVFSAQRQHNVYTFLIGDESFFQTRQTTSVPGLHILPAVFDLAGAEVELVFLEQRDLLLKKKLFHVKHLYDYIFIDCPPSLGLLTLNALICSTKVMVPLQCEFFALEGLSHLIANVKKVRETRNQALSIGGVILTMFDKKSKFNHDIVEEVRSFLGKIVFNTIIPRSVKVSEASSHGVPIVFYKPTTISDYFLELSKEFMEKCP